MFWRVLHYFRNGPNAESTFGTSNDNQGVTDGQNILMDYQAARQSQMNALSSHCILTFKAFKSLKYMHLYFSIGLHIM